MLLSQRSSRPLLAAHTLALGLIALGVQAQPTSWAWEKHGSGDNDAHVFDVAIDSVNQWVYAAGSYQEDANTIFNLPAKVGGTDAFLAKFDLNGTLLWSIRMASGNDDAATAVTVDQSTGRVYVAGSYKAALSLSVVTGTAPGALAFAGGSDVFTACYAMNGSCIWSARAGGPSDDAPTGIAVNASGVFVTGQYTRRIRFFGNVPIDPIIGTSDSHQHLFVVNYPLDSGEPRWAINAVNGQNNNGGRCTADATAAYVTGSFNAATLPWYASDGTLLSTATAGGTRTNCHVLAVSNTGTVPWSTAFTNPNSTAGAAYGVAAGCGLVYVTGQIGNGATFPGYGALTDVSNVGSNYLYLAALKKSNGQAYDVRTAYSSNHNGSVYGTQVSVTAGGTVYLTGVFRQDLHFGTTGLSLSDKDDDLFIGRFTSYLTPEWLMAVNNDGDEQPWGLAAANDRSLFLGGTYSDDLSLQPYTLHGNDHLSVFVTRINDPDAALYPADPSRWHAPTSSLCSSSGTLDLSTVLRGPTRGYGAAVTAYESSGTSNQNALLGAPNGAGAVITGNNSYITVDMGLALNAGDRIWVTWQENSDLITLLGTAYLQVEASYDGTTWVVDPSMPSHNLNILQPAYITSVFTLSTDARYIRFRRVNPPSGTDLNIDAVMYRTGNLLNGTWSGTGVSSAGVFDPTGLNGTYPITYTVNLGSCSYSTTHSITVVQGPGGGTFSGNTTACPGTSSGTLSIAGHTGSIARWEYSTDGFVNTTIIPSTSASITTPTMTQNTRFRVLLTSSGCPNAYSNTATIVVQDNVAPVLTCPHDTTVYTPAAQCGANVTYALPLVTDNCSTGLIAAPALAGQAPGSLFPVGTNAVLMKAADLAGNTGTCQFTITVIDSVRPVINCPPSITRASEPGICGAHVTYATPTATDNCTVASITLQAGSASGSVFPVGTTPVTYRATDASGRWSQCTFNVIVADSTAPTFACPGAISVNADPGLCGAHVTYVLPSALDACGGTIAVVPVNSAQAPGALFPIGTTTVQLKATDAAGNTSTCSFSITVLDVVPPVITCPANIAATTEIGVCGAHVTYTMPNATDGCSPSVTVAAVDPAKAPGSLFPLGTTTVLLRATDGSGNTADCSFTITVTDNVPPTITCPPGQVLTLTSTAACGMAATYITPVATDNCSTLAMTQTEGLPSGATFPVGDTRMTFVASDGPNNAQCSFHIAVVDAAPPVVAPASVTASTPVGQCTATVNWVTPAVSSNCPACATVASLNGYVALGAYNGNAFYLSPSGASWYGAYGAAIAAGGNLAVMHDAAENTWLRNAVTTAGTASYWIGLNDVAVDDQFHWTNATAVAYTNWGSGFPGTGANTTDAVATLPSGQWRDLVPATQLAFVIEVPSACNTAQLISGPVPGSSLAPGTYSANYQATDAAGNTGSASVSITVQGPAPAALTYPVASACTSAAAFAPSLAGPMTATARFSSSSGLAIDSLTGVITPALSQPGSYTVTFNIPMALGCAPNSATFHVTVLAASNAGTDGALALCSADPSTSLFNALGGSPQSGGAWTFNGLPHGSTYDPATDGPGTYTYLISGSAPCVNDTALVIVTETAATTWYQDLDNDGAGDAANTLQACAQPTGYVANNNDQCPADPNKITPGQCGCGVADTDSDGDGTANCNDGCPTDPNKVAPGLCGCGVADTDSDGDGTPNCNDGCPNDPNKIAPGLCGCGVADTDTDGDGTPNCNDGCPTDPNKVAPGQCGCGVSDIDTDSDGIADCHDNCPSLAGQIGDPCDDGNANTTNDAISATCVCVGQPLDCLGVPNGTTLPGSPCDDGNACTINDVYSAACVCAGTFQDTDNDGTCDANDGCPTDPNKIAPGQCGCGVSDIDTDSDGIADCHDNCPSLAGQIGDPCDDGNANTTNDAISATCVCVGQPLDCLGVPNGTTLPGSPCDDGNACTINDVYSAACVCAGTFQDTDNDGTCDANDGCPSDPNKIAPGQCGCGVSDLDTDSDGIADCHDNCPALAGQIGDPCDDGNANTANDVISAACVCVGQPLDCLGVPNGTTLPGSPCDDGNACTINDVYSAACVCAGTFQDTDNDGTCDANDGCPTDPNKIAPGQCGCGISDIDTDSDGIADCNDNCPSLAGQIGDPCDDGNANTTNDAISAACVCVGQPLDCLGVPNGTTLPGSPCDDGNACTINDVYSAACVCAGTFQDTDNDGTCDANDGCPTDPNKIAPGQCGCGVSDIDTDSDGIADCHDNCPSLAGQIGDPCDDGDPGTGSDVITAACTCQGTALPIDCLGQPGGAAMPGSACDDGNVNTGADTWTADCECVGQLIDCNGVPGGSALPGSACDDGDAGTVNDIYTAACICAGTSTNCDDGDPCTTDVFDGTGCVHTALPILSAGADHDTTLCAGSTFDLSTLLNGASSGGTWSPQGPVITVGGATTYTYSVGNACSTDEAQFQLTLLPPASAGADSTVSICQGASVNLNLALSVDSANGVWSGPTVVTPQQTTTYTFAVGNACGIDVAEITVQVDQPVSGGTGLDATVCMGTLIDLDTLLIGATPGGTWTGGAHVIMAMSSQTYTYTVHGCSGTASNNVNITVIPLPDAGTSIALTLCVTDTAMNMVDLLGADGTGTWSGPVAVQNDLLDPAAMPSGNYIYLVTGACGSDMDTVYVTVNAPGDPAWNAPSQLCSTSGAIDLTTLVVGDGGGAWSGTGVSGTHFDPTHATGAIEITYTTGQGTCSATETHTISVIPGPIADAGPDTAVCGLSHAMQAVIITVPGTWTAPAGAVLSDVHDPHAIATVLMEGSYRFSWTVGDAQCQAVDSVAITFHDPLEPLGVDAGPDQTLEARTSTMLHGSASQGTTLQWISLNEQVMVLSPADSITEVVGLLPGDNVFLLHATRGACNEGWDTVVVRVNDIFIPQGFSPNGDGVNDEFRITGIELFPDNDLMVFDRWGTEVVHAHGYHNEWTGNGRNGQRLPDDTYFYVLNLTPERTYNGFVVVKR